MSLHTYPEILPEDFLSPIKGKPNVIYTIFGYVILGKIPTVVVQSSSTFFTCSLLSLKDTLQKFWVIEEVELSRYISNPDDVRCEEYFTKTHSLTKEGQYIVSFFFRDSMSPQFPNFRQGALCRFNKLKLWFYRNPSLLTEYSNFMQKYVNFEHMNLAVSNSAANLIPDHSVVKTDFSKLKSGFRC